MVQFQWRTNPEVIARLVNADTIKTWKSSSVVLKPNEACASIIDGKIGEIVNDQVVENIGGGFSRFLGDFLGISAKDRRILFVMTGPVDISVPFTQALANGDTANGIAQFRIQIRRNDVPKLLNIFANRAPVLDRVLLSGIIGPEAQHKLIMPMISQSKTIQELRTADKQNEFAMRSEMELRPLFTSYGITLLNAMLITQPTDLERMNALQTRLTSAMATDALQNEASIAQLAHQEGITVRRIECETNIAKAHAKGEVVVEVEKELHALRKQEAVWEAELQRDSARAALEQKTMEDKTSLAMSMFEQVQQKKKDRMAASSDHKERMMNLAAEHGALTPDVMKEYLKQEGGNMSTDPTVCPSCSKPIDVTWNACPYCASSLGV